MIRAFDTSWWSNLPAPRRRAIRRAVELALVAMLAVQYARIATTLLSPPSAADAIALPLLPNAAPPRDVLGSFDPFFRLQPQDAPAQVTSLALTLHGIRQDQASGRGSAIIGTPDGAQRSIAVGEEIVPGATLAEVRFDSVVLSRGGAAEELYMDQPAADQPPAPEM
jgi:general secretion pathway protein C